MHRRYDLARIKSGRWELLLNEIALKATDKLMDTIIVKDICWKIYRDICERKNLPITYEADYGKQFEFIKKMLYQYRCINEVVNKMEKDKLIMSEKACVSTSINSSIVEDK